MGITKEEKLEIIKRFGKNEKDSGRIWRKRTFSGTATSLKNWDSEDNKGY